MVAHKHPFLQIANLRKVRRGSLLKFADSNLEAMVTSIGEPTRAVVIGGEGSVETNHTVHPAGNVASFPFGPSIGGRVFDGRGNLIDGGPPLSSSRNIPLLQLPKLRPCDHAPVVDAVHTGVALVDFLTPVGRGLRTLIVGNRGSGKTKLATDIVVAQSSQDRSAITKLHCIYVCIGKTKEQVDEIRIELQERGALDNVTIITEPEDATPSVQDLAVHAGFALGKEYRDMGLHCMVVIDDWTAHAVQYFRLQQTAFGSYPDDLLMTHARLLEQGAQLADHRGGGSLTVLGLMQTDFMGDDLERLVGQLTVQANSGRVDHVIHLADDIASWPPIESRTASARLPPRFVVPGMRQLRRTCDHLLYESEVAAERVEVLRGMKWEVEEHDMEEKVFLDKFQLLFSQERGSHVSVAELYVLAIAAARQEILGRVETSLMARYRDALLAHMSTHHKSLMAQLTDLHHAPDPPLPSNVLDIVQKFERQFVRASITPKAGQARLRVAAKKSPPQPPTRLSRAMNWFQSLVGKPDFKKNARFVKDDDRTSL